jgi:hypothetical protein
MKQSKDWLKLIEQDMKSRKNDMLVMLDDGTTLDIERSQKIGDEWFFGFANSDLEDLIPEFCMDSALYAIANNAIIRLLLDIEDEDLIHRLVEQSIETARDIQQHRKDAE